MADYDSQFSVPEILQNSCSNNLQNVANIIFHLEVSFCHLTFQIQQVLSLSISIQYDVGFTQIDPFSSISKSMQTKIV